MSKGEPRNKAREIAKSRKTSYNLEYIRYITTKSLKRLAESTKGLAKQAVKLTISLNKLKEVLSKGGMCENDRSTEEKNRDIVAWGNEHTTDRADVTCQGD